MHVFRNIVHMSNDELEKVTALDTQLIAHKDFTHFYYGVEDGWCPLDYGLSFNASLQRILRVGNGEAITQRSCSHRRSEL